MTDNRFLGAACLVAVSGACGAGLALMNGSKVVFALLIAATVVVAGVVGYKASPSPDGCSPDVNPSTTTMRLPLSAALGGVFLYHLAFNSLSESTRLRAATFLTAGILFLACVGVCVVRSALRNQLALILCAFLAMGGVALLAGTWLEARPEALCRLLLPLAVGACFLLQDATRQLKVAAHLSAVTILIASIVAAIHGFSVIASVPRLQPFTGGFDGAHASAYLIAVSIIIQYQAIRAGAIPRSRGVTAVAVGLLVLAGLRVATPVVMLAAYAITRLMMGAAFDKRRRQRAFFCLFLVGIAVAGSMVVREMSLRGGDGSSAVSADLMASGRLTTWTERLGILSERPVSELLVGEGPDSDRYTSTVWWWEAKDSHNDVLRIFLEYGLVGSMFIVLFVTALVKWSGRAALPHVMFLVAGSLLSNALLFRPMHALLFWFSLAVEAGISRGDTATTSDDTATIPYPSQRTAALVPSR